MNVLITGSSGFIGRALVSFLERKGCRVIKAVRRKSTGKDEVFFDAATGEYNFKGFDGFDTVIHLAGENISKGFWTEKKKKKILESRVVGTRNLVKVMRGLKHPPKVFICASAVGYYGDHEGRITEETPSGEGFLADVCREWEAAAFELHNGITRVIVARFGVVLSSEGGALKSMRSLFSLGLGGKIGTGKQFIPWIALEDLLRGLYHAIEKEEVKGAVNMVASEPVRQEVFAHVLADVLHRPCFFKIPKILLFGQKLKNLTLPSLEVYPVRLQRTGFNFRYTDLKKTLKDLLEKQ